MSMPKYFGKFRIGESLECFEVDCRWFRVYDGESTYIAKMYRINNIPDTEVLGLYVKRGKKWIEEVQHFTQN